MARTIEVAAFTIVDDGKKIAEFDGYDELYAWADKNREKYPDIISVVMGDPYLIMMFGECPIKYDMKKGTFTVLSWHEVPRGESKK